MERSVAPVVGRTQAKLVEASVGRDTHLLQQRPPGVHAACFGRPVGAAAKAKVARLLLLLLQLPCLLFFGEPRGFSGVLKQPSQLRLKAFFLLGFGFAFVFAFACAFAFALLSGVCAVVFFDHVVGSGVVVAVVISVARRRGKAGEAREELAHEKRGERVVAHDQAGPEGACGPQPQCVFHLQPSARACTMVQKKEKEI